MRRFRAGDKVDDHCRSCKIERMHAVIVASGEGVPLRVLCDTCGSQHNYRGGRAPAVRPGSSSGEEPAPETWGVVSERERSLPMEGERPSADGDLELMLRRVIREEAGVTPVAPAAKWRGGELVLRPGNPELQEKSWPIETLFHKVVMVRNRLRTLEQQVNGSDLPNDVKLKLQGYISGCYGSLTSFNVLFAEEDDRFRGSSR